MLSVFSNCFASHSNLDAVRSGMEVVIRGVAENLTANELEELGWEKHATQTAHFSYDLAARSVSPYPPLDPFMNSRARSAGSLECKGTSLHERYWNTWQWIRWLHDNGVDVSRPKVGIWRYNVFWVDWESRTYPWVCLCLRIRHGMSLQLLICTEAVHSGSAFFVALRSVLLRLRSNT